MVPLGVDAASYDEAQPVARAEIDAPPEGVLIACPYERSGRNRIATLFRTLSLLVPRHRDMHAVVFGPGSLDDELRLHAAALGVSSALTFIGDIDAPLPVMRAASIVWSVADGDGGAYACLDAMGLRLPVIAERTVLYQHYVADGISGLLLSPADPATRRPSRRIHRRRGQVSLDGQRRTRARPARVPRVGDGHGARASVVRGRAPGSSLVAR